MPTYPIIFVHGIQGSWLKNEYPVDYDNEVLWTAVLKRRYHQLPLSDIDAAVDETPERFIFAHQAVPLIYESIVDELRKEVSPYVYVFTYDWRKDNRLSAIRLGRFVDLVLQTVSAHEKKARRRPPRRVILIGHSMGGLVIKWYTTKVLTPRAVGAKVAKIVTIATPYRGSLKAVEAILPGARNLFGVETGKAMRHASRTMPGVYQLLPTWDKAVVEAGSPRSMDIFRAGSWQKSLAAKIAQKHGPRFFQGMLDDARAFTDVVKKPYPPSLRRRLFVAFGKGSETWWQVGVDTRRDNFFEFKDAKSDKQGDGTVHCSSGEVAGLPTGRRFEDEKRGIKDRIIGQHANMPNHSDLQDWLLGVLGANPHAAGAFESPL